MVAVTLMRTDVKSLHLAHPLVEPASRFQLTLAGALMLAAAGIWLFVLPLELLRLAAG